MKVAGLCLFLHFLFYEHLASVSDVDALLRLVQALTSKVVDEVIPFRRGFRRGYPCRSLFPCIAHGFRICEAYVIEPRCAFSVDIGNKSVPRWLTLHASFLGMTCDDFFFVAPPAPDRREELTLSELCNNQTATASTELSVEAVVYRQVPDV